MSSKHSIRLGEVRGITIRVHNAALVLLAFFLLLSPERTLLAVLILAPIILLHELGHSVVAQHFGIRVIDITFWPFGGMARMSEIPEDARVEGLIAIAGPLVNFALALLALPFALLPGPWSGLAFPFFAMNLVLGGFNLLPAFPMDGGRVLRAWLGRGGDWLGATVRAVRVGRVVAVLMIVAGFASLNFVLVLIGLFVWWTGGQELAAVRLRHQGPPLWSFGPFRAFWPEGMRPSEPRRARAEPAGSAVAEEPPIEFDREAELRARRPVERGDSRARGFSAEDLARLERFPGSLRQFRSEP